MWALLCLSPGPGCLGACPWVEVYDWSSYIAVQKHMASQVHWQMQVDKVPNASSIVDT